MTIDTEKLKASAEMHLKRGDRMMFEPSDILGLLTEIEALKKDIESYMQACNYEVNRSTKFEEVIERAKEWLKSGSSWDEKNKLAAAIEALGEHETIVERGTKAWADVENATNWVEKLRGE